MSKETRKRLDHLQYHWGDAYEITVEDGGKWRAIRRDDPKEKCPLEAQAAGTLLRAIHEDYRLRPVLREPPDVPR